MTVTTIFPRSRRPVQRSGTGVRRHQVEAAGSARWSWWVIVAISLQGAVALAGLLIFGHALTRGGL